MRNRLLYGIIGFVIFAALFQIFASPVITPFLNQLINRVVNPPAQACEADVDCTVAYTTCTNTCAAKPVHRNWTPYCPLFERPTQQVIGQLKQDCPPINRTAECVNGMCRPALANGQRP